MYTQEFRFMHEMYDFDFFTRDKKPYVLLTLTQGSHGDLSFIILEPQFDNLNTPDTNRGIYYPFKNGVVKMEYDRRLSPVFDADIGGGSR
ncbi:hypothetical protein FACS189483_04130 [Spirochaetia bacterium]|nr:hypothetical protein FACS189483_04130 [Spirochaetia bacterium]